MQQCLKTQGPDYGSAKGIGNLAIEAYRMLQFTKDLNER